MAIDYRVFPTAGRFDSSDSSYDSGTNIVTEYNIASIVNQLVDKDGFVIDSSFNINNPHLNFNIAGYYFQARNFIPEANSTIVGDYVKFTNINNEIKASICISNSTDMPSYNQLILCANNNWDETDSLIILKKQGNNWQIPLRSRIHFNTYIDDGDLDSSN